MKTKEELKYHIDQIYRLLDQVEEDLRSAKNWGIFDTFFQGGLFSSLIKHDKIDEAENRMNYLLSELEDLENELGEANIHFTRDLNISDFNKFMDIFADNIFSDLITQSSINDGLANIDKIRNYLNRIEDNL